MWHGEALLRIEFVKSVALSTVGLVLGIRSTFVAWLLGMNRIQFAQNSFLAGLGISDSG